MRFRSFCVSTSLLWAGILFSALLSCDLKSDETWNNPADPLGSSYHPPTLRLEGDTLFVDSSKVAVRVVATSANSRIAKIEWNVDGIGWADEAFASKDSILSCHLPRLSEAGHTVMARVQDSTGLWSPRDTFHLRVWNNPPTLVHVRDTALLTGKSVSVALLARDSEAADHKVKKYLFDTTGNGWDSSTTAPTLRFSSGIGTVRKVRWGARDDLGKTTLDSFDVRFLPDVPVLHPVSDTALSASRTLVASLKASPLEGSASAIALYRWSLDGGATWDSSATGTLSVANAAGGTKTVIWSARNAAGSLSNQDTFTIGFVPAPTIASVQVDSLLQNWTGTAGTLDASWIGSVAGFPNEPTTWTLWLGEVGSLTQVYQGTATSWSKPGVDSGKTFQYRLVARNAYGDSAAISGSAKVKYTVIPKTSDGIPWNLNVEYGTLTDSRDGQTYYTVKIGNQRWMAQNLNHAPSGGNSWCYNDVSANCSTYGRLYDWATAMGLPTNFNTIQSNAALPRQGECPRNWHIPSDSEWSVLVDAVGGSSAGTTLKSQSGWSSISVSRSVKYSVDGEIIDSVVTLDTVIAGQNGMDVEGFRALPAGSQYSGGIVSYPFGKTGVWWTATEGGTAYATYRYMGANDSAVGRNQYDSGLKRNGFSLRCVSD